MILLAKKILFLYRALLFKKLKKALTLSLFFFSVVP